MQSAMFIGRFQPFHNGHLDIVKKILKDNEKIIITIGSAEKNFLPQNPLTAGERFQLIEAALKEAKIPADKFCIIPVRNVNNFALWVKHINMYVPPYTKIYTGSKIVKACYEGQHHEKGPTVVQIEREVQVSATTIREAIMNDNDWEDLVPKAVANLLKKWEISRRIKTIHGTMDLTKYNNLY